jgi:hypothetical protein
MLKNRKARRASIHYLKNCLIFLCLFAPSAWMIATIPPLWRDVDAYLQLTQHPLVTTFWGHGAAYSYVAKIPLFLGEQWERWRGVSPVTPESGLSALTDTGVWLLIFGQHLALAGAAYYFISAISRSFWVRLILSLVWASCALFFTFAHCVGSESLSVILMIVVAAQGLRLITSDKGSSWKDWYLFAGALWLCLLSRQVNALLILLLPAAFLLSWRRTTIFRDATIALAIGISCLLVANSLPKQLARKTKLHPHSRLGHTFLFRLQFLHELSPAARTALLKKAITRTKSAEPRKLITLLEQMHDEQADTRPESFTQAAIPVLFPGATNVPWEKLDVALNEMASAFLLPPAPELLRATGKDLAAALKMPATDIIDNLFATTGYFFEHRDAMPGCAGLVTFRNSSAQAIARIPSEHPYFYLWRRVTANRAVVPWLITLTLLLLFARRNKEVSATIPPYAVALTAIGFLITIANSLLTEYLPRFVAPLWLLLILSFLLLAGSTAEMWRVRRAAISPEPMGVAESRVKPRRTC